MLLELKRIAYKTDYTIGNLYIDGLYFCDTLEDPVRKNKIFGKTAIPAGTYRVTLSWSPKFKRVLPMLHDVPKFTGIRMHRGNTAKDTHGCPLVGENKRPGMVINSTKYEEALVKLMQGQNDMWINVS